MRFLHYKKTTKEKIKEATFDMLAEKGYKELTMRDIAQKAEAAVGQLTYYYKTKESLVFSVLDEILAGFMEEIESKIVNSDEKIKTILEYYNDCCSKEPELTKVLLSFTTEALWNSKIRERLSAHNMKITKLVEDVYIENGLSKEEAEVKSEFLMLSLSGMMAHQVLHCGVQQHTNGYKKILMNI